MRQKYILVKADQPYTRDIMNIIKGYEQKYVYKICRQRDNFSEDSYFIVMEVLFKPYMVKDIGMDTFFTKEEAEEKLRNLVW